MSTLRTTNLQHASAASPAIVLASDGSATAQLSSLNGGALSGARNRIINGDMRIDQRNAGASVTQTVSQVYAVDRWWMYGDVTSKLTLQQNAGSVTPPAGFTHYYGVTVASAHTPTASQNFNLVQNIEGFNTADLAYGTANAKTVTLSFWIRSSLTGTFGGCLGNSVGNRSYVFSYAISAANTWEYKTITIPGDTSGSWLPNNVALTGTGIGVTFGLGNGSSYVTTAGSWVAGDYRGPTGQVNVVANAGATWYITGVQLEAGTVATPFERRSYGQELALCQRYFETAGGTYLQQTRADTGTKIVGTILFTVVKRASPTASITTNAINVTPTGTWTELMGGYPARTGTINASATGFSYIDFGATTGNPINGSWIASAEL